MMVKKVVVVVIISSLIIRSLNNNHHNNIIVIIDRVLVYRKYLIVACDKRYNLLRFPYYPGWVAPAANRYLN